VTKEAPTACTDTAESVTKGAEEKDKTGVK